MSGWIRKGVWWKKIAVECFILSLAASTQTCIMQCQIHSVQSASHSFTLAIWNVDCIHHQSCPYMFPHTGYRMQLHAFKPRCFSQQPQYSPESPVGHYSRCAPTPSRSTSKLPQQQCLGAQTMMRRQSLTPPQYNSMPSPQLAAATCTDVQPNPNKSCRLSLRQSPTSSCQV